MVMSIYILNSTPGTSQRGNTFLRQVQAEFDAGVDSITPVVEVGAISCFMWSPEPLQ